MEGQGGGGGRGGGGRVETRRDARVEGVWVATGGVDSVLSEGKVSPLRSLGGDAARPQRAHASADRPTRVGRWTWRLGPRGGSGRSLPCKKRA